MRVLIVDDSRLIRQLATMAFAGAAGWDVEAAESGSEGIRLAERHAPEAILLDVMMPGLDGPATLAELKASRLTRDIPVIFLTAHEGAAEHAAFTTLGAVGVIQKPFEVSRLAEQVAGMLGRAA